jgi:hypothetical protein
VQYFKQQQCGVQLHWPFASASFDVDKAANVATKALPTRRSPRRLTSVLCCKPTPSTSELSVVITALSSSRCRIEFSEEFAAFVK